MRIKRVQAAAFEQDKKDETSTVLQCDFAMAYSCEYQNEIQSALWSRASVNLFTAMFHHGTSLPQPYLIVTDSKNKDKDAVANFITKLVQSESNKIKSKFQIYTDGPTSEFKNKFITKFISDLNKETGCEVVEWKYFATSHGKGSVDGIGGRDKSLDRQATKSKSGACNVQNSLEFYYLVKKLMPGVKAIHVSESEITAFVQMECPWENVKIIPGILKAHCITCEKYGFVSLFVDDSKDNVISNMKYLDCEDEMEVDDVNAGEDGEEKVVVGDWVVVNYDDKMYPGKVVDGSLKVTVMKACFPTGWKWPDTIDEIFYKNEFVVKKINPPAPYNSRGVWQFPDSILRGL